MSRINRVPHGLQDILGSVSQGDNPNDILTEVRAITDLFPLWAMERLAVSRVSATLVSLGTNMDLPIPDGELWIPHAFSTGIVGANTVGDEFAMEMLILNTPNIFGTTSRFWSSEVHTFSQIGELRTFTYTFPFPIAFGAGTVFRFSPSRLAQTVNNIGEGSLFYWLLNT